MDFLYLLPGAFFAPVIHEFVKARVSTALGDRQPAKNGFITWNPFKFVEPIGFFMMLYFQVGWGRPVDTSPFYYRDKRKGIALTYTVPILANVAVGAVALILLGLVHTPLMNWAAGFGAMAENAMLISLDGRRGLNWSVVIEHTQNVPPWFYLALALNELAVPFARANIGLAIFSLVPIFPMAANKLLHLFVSPETSVRLNHYEKPLQILMFLLLIFGVLQGIIFPIRETIIRMFM